jgi:hypothetical protein
MTATSLCACVRAMGGNASYECSARDSAFAASDPRHNYSL